MQYRYTGKATDTMLVPVHTLSRSEHAVLDVFAVVRRADDRTNSSSFCAKALVADGEGDGTLTLLTLASASAIGEKVQPAANISCLSVGFGDDVVAVLHFNEADECEVEVTIVVQVHRID